MWQLLVDETPIAPNAIRSLYALLQQPVCAALREPMMKRCVACLRKHKAVVNALPLLTGLLQASHGETWCVSDDRRLDPLRDGQEDARTAHRRRHARIARLGACDSNVCT
jgi:hypothetical protein